MYRLKPRTLVVAEGADNSGKSVTIDALRELLAGDPLPMFTHQPSGSSGMTNTIYKFLEEVENLDPLARQYMHLACHSQHYQESIIPTLEKRGVVMDRCWISTVVYGWYQQQKIQDYFTFREFVKLAKAPTQGTMPSAVFMFMHQYGEQNSALQFSYTQFTEWLVGWKDFPVIVMKAKGTPEEKAKAMLQSLIELDLVGLYDKPVRR